MESLDRQGKKFWCKTMGIRKPWIGFDLVNDGMQIFFKSLSSRIGI